MLQAAWSHLKSRRKVKFDFVVYYSEEFERYVPVYDPNRLPEFLEALKPETWIGSSADQRLFQSLLEDGEVYDPEKHEGHLRCPDGCGAHMKYKDADGTEASRFKLDKKSGPEEQKQPKHRDDCKYKPEPRPRRIDIDTSNSRGLIEQQFNDRSSNHISNQIHHAITRSNYEELIGRKIKKAGTAADFLKILGKGDLTKDIFVDQYQIIQGEDFFIRDAKKIKLLYKSLEEEQGVSHFRAILFQVSQAGDKMKPSIRMSVTSQRTFYRREGGDNGYDGTEHFIVPRALPELAGSNGARSCFPVPGAYLVIGDVKKGEIKERDDVFIRHMDIIIRSPAQVIAVEMGANLKPRHMECDPR